MSVRKFSEYIQLVYLLAVPLLALLSVLQVRILQDVKDTSLIDYQKEKLLMFAVRTEGEDL